MTEAAQTTTDTDLLALTADVKESDIVTMELGAGGATTSFVIWPEGEHNGQFQWYHVHATKPDCSTHDWRLRQWNWEDGWDLVEKITYEMKNNSQQGEP